MTSGKKEVEVILSGEFVEEGSSLAIANFDDLNISANKIEPKFTYKIKAKLS